jgi:hypothetical protein
MRKTTKLRINTVNVNGDFDSFKAALNRSILGVTFRKFKRKKSQFYQHRVHNAAIAQKICEKLYEYLLVNEHLHVGRNLRDFKLRTSLTVEWSETGKILIVSDVVVSIYLEIGELAVDNLQASGISDKVKIDLFYSDIDRASQKLRSELPNIMNSIGKDNFDYSEHNFSAEGKETARLWNVKYVPTVIINDKKRLEDIDERKLRQEIEGAFAPDIKSADPQFKFANGAKSNVTLLAKVLKTP